MGASYPAGIVNGYGETLELSTVLASLGTPGEETKQAIIYNPNYDFRLHINPAVIAALFYDASNDVGARFERGGTTDSLKRDLTDRSATGSGTALDDATTSDRLYICLPDIIGGLHIDMFGEPGSAHNNNRWPGTECALTVNYWNGEDWSDISVTDGTKLGGIRSLYADGNLTWTKPTDWMAAHLGGNNFDGTIKGMSITDKDAPGTYGFWLQLLWSSALDGNVEIANIWTLNKNTNRLFFRGGQEYPISFDARNVGAIEAILESDKIPNDSAKDTMEINWVRTVNM